MFCVVWEKIKWKMNSITLVGPSDDHDFSPGLHFNGTPVWLLQIFQKIPERVIQEEQFRSSFQEGLNNWSTCGHGLSSRDKDRHQEILSKWGVRRWKFSSDPQRPAWCGNPVWQRHCCGGWIEALFSRGACRPSPCLVLPSCSRGLLRIWEQTLFPSGSRL